jgi:hypothetical protein
MYEMDMVFLRLVVVVVVVVRLLRASQSQWEGLLQQSCGGR